MKSFFKILSVLYISIGLTMIVPPVMAAHHMPGKGVTVQPARATWNTGFFPGGTGAQGAGNYGLQGQNAQRPSEPHFLQIRRPWRCGLLDQRLVPQSRQPAAKELLRQSGQIWIRPPRPAVFRGTWYPSGRSKNTTSSLWMILNVMKSERRSIPMVDGKADLTACPPGWGCENVIAHHMKVYDLDDYHQSGQGLL